MQKHWYAVHTYSGHEKKVKTNIERRAETMGLKSKVFDILVPTEKESRVRQGKKSEIDRKVFPGYVFVEMVLDDNTWYLVKSTTGVIGFVGDASRRIVKDSEIRDISRPWRSPRPSRSSGPSGKSARPCASTPARSPTSPAPSRRSMRPKTRSRC